MQHTQLPHMTPKQQHILLLLYRFRFLTRIQIQTLLHNPDLKNINTWLKDLYDKNYIGRIVNTKDKVNTIPHIYFIDLNGIRFLKTQATCKKEYIMRLYREDKKGEEFINTCLLIADIYLQLAQKYADKFSFYTHSDFSIKGLIRDILPAFTYNKLETDGYIIGELFKEKMPKYAIEFRIKQYLRFFTSSKWTSHEKPPIILFISPTIQLEESIYRLTKKIFREEGEDSLKVRFTTREQIKGNGIEGEVWKKITDL